jgi:Guanylate-binding protein, N-terminal domain
MPNGETLDLIVMDCEGFGGMDENENHDTRIFLFAILLSSYFIYNSLGSIDENALNTLSLVINLVKDIKSKMNSNGGASDMGLIDNFPALLWVVRDFTLKMEDEKGNPLTAK